MALLYTPTTNTAQPLPQFKLKTVDGQEYSSNQIQKGHPAVVAFICNHCPYVKAIEDRLIQLSKKLKDLQVPMIAICANDPSEYPDDRPEKLLERWTQKGYEFPYLVDENQDVARSFGAVCTPDFFVYNMDLKLAYRGRLDDSWKDASKVTREELFEAVKALAKNEAPPLEKPSMGCSIKWRS